MRRLRPYLPTIIPLLGFLILPTLLYFDVTIGSKTMLPIDNLYEWAPWAASAAELGVGSPHNGLISDMILQNVVWKQYVRETILAGDIPLWNPHLFAGVPFLAAGQHSAYYPFSWLFFVMPLTKAYGWYALSQVWLAGVFMYVYGRVLNLSRPSAFIAGLVFQGCGTLIISAAVFPMVSGAIVWLPLLLACIERGIGDWGSGAGDRGLGIGDQKASNIPQFLWLGIGAVGLGMQILAGHIEYTIYTLLVMGLYAAWRLASVGILASRTGQPWRQRVLVPAFQLLGMVLVGLMLGGIQLVPLYELGQVNFRESSSTLEEIRFYGFQERRVITLAIPNFFGNPTHHDYRDPFTGEIIPFETNYEGQPKRDSAWGFKNHVEGAIYLGILPLILAGLAVVRLWRNGRIQFFVLLSLASLGFIFGTPLYGLLYYGLPFVNQLHTPFRWVFPLSVCVAVLAGYGVDWVLGIGDLGFGTGEQSTDNSQQSTSNKPLASRFSPLASRYLPLVTIFAGILVLGGLGVSLWQYGRFASLVERVFLGLALATTAFPSAEAFYGYQFWQLLIFGLMVLGSGIVLWLGNKGFKRPFILAAAFLIIADLFLAGRNFNTAVDASLLDHKPELVQWLEQQPGQWRITSFTPNGGAPLNANSGWFYGFEDIRGYDSIIPKQYTNYMATLEPQNGLIYNKIQPVGAHATLDSPLLDVLNVKYVITPDVIGPPKFEQVWEGAGLRIYENLGVAPRAYTLPQTSTVVSEDPLTDLRQYDPRQYAIVGGSSGIDDSRLTINENDPPIPNSYTPATMMHYSNREVIVEASVTSPSWLILNDSYFPGWNAFVTDISLSDSEEEQVDVHLVNGNFRGILLEEGDWSIRFRYSPSSFWLGGLASVMGAIILVFAGVVIGWQRFSGETSEQSMVQRLAKNSVAPMVLNLFNKGIDFAFALYYLRVLGPADTGSYQTAITTAVLFEIISNFGLDILLIRDVSQAREKSASYLLNSTVLRLGMGLIAAMPIL
ncbi:MAG: oligosaccharide flippase family protein, partial [Chloroflexota bacterium]